VPETIGIVYLKRKGQREEKPPMGSRREGGKECERKARQTTKERGGGGMVTQLAKKPDGKSWGLQESDGGRELGEGGRGKGLKKKKKEINGCGG